MQIHCIIRANPLYYKKCDRQLLGENRRRVCLQLFMEMLKERLKIRILILIIRIHRSGLKILL